MNGENIAIRKVRDSNGYEPSDGKGFHEGVVWDDIIIPPDGLNRGASAPSLETLTGGIKVNAFDGVGTSEELSGSFELPHGYKEGTDLRPHIHWTPSDVSAGDVKWNFEYVIGNVDEVMSGATVDAVDSSDETLLKSQVVETGVIDGTGLKIGAQCHFRLYRNPTDVVDTYGADAFLSTLGIHYEVDGDGSNSPFLK